MNNLEKSLKRFINDYIYIPITFAFIYFRDLYKINKIYKGFEYMSLNEVKKTALVFDKDNKNVVGELSAEIVKIISELRPKPKIILLDGDNKSVVKQFKNRLGLRRSTVLTAGINDEFDYRWNFENNPPRMPKFDLISSQAMLEHLIDPYKHLCDLTKLLKEGGYLLVHSVMPGFPYHRFPIDSVRFFPDWFEESADRLNLEIVRKFRREFQLFYLFRKNI